LDNSKANKIAESQPFTILEGKKGEWKGLIVFHSGAVKREISLFG